MNFVILIALAWVIWAILVALILALMAGAREADERAEIEQMSTFIRERYPVLNLRWAGLEELREVYHYARELERATDGLHA